MTFRYHLLPALLLAASALYCPARAQQPSLPAAPAASSGTGSLTGTVLDSLKKEAVPYATVVLLPPAPNDKPITGVAADDNGKFSLTKLAPGPARLRVSYVGYGTQTRAVTITAGATDAGTFRLPVAGTALDEAVIVGTKPVVEMRPDRMIYNADQDVTNTGGTAADVLRKAPLLAVDGDGKVTMRGSGNFKVLVNNKPSPTLASNLAEALKSIPADQIKSVEIITTPPAKYDGEGTAGIINIVLKKGVDRGLNGRVGASGGNRNTSLNTALNFKKGKLGFTSSANTGTWYNPNEFERARYGKQDGSALTQNSAGKSNGHWYYGTLGMDYDLSEHQSLSLAGSVQGYLGDNTSNLFSTYTAPTSANQLFSRGTVNNFSGVNGELTGTYTKTFAQPKREWSILGQYANNSSTFGYDYDQFQNSYTTLDHGQASYRERSQGRTPGHEYTLQTDFTQPFGEKQTLETGLKAIWRHTGSVADVDTLNPLVNSDFVRATRRATDFSYDQSVQAAYATYSFAPSKKLHLSLGGRVERTSLTASFRTNGSDIPPHSYTTPLPNGNVQYSFSDNNSLRLAYSRRITRPYIDYLNPFVNRSDPQNISYGNPDLDPELTDSYELSFNTNGKAGSLNIAASARRTGNAIEGVRQSTSTPGVTIQTYANVAANAFYQLNFYGSAKPAKGWDLSGGPDVQYIVRRSPTLGIERRGFTASMNFNTSYKLPKGFTIQGFLFGSLPSPDLQGTGPANLYYQLGGKKTFLKEKADLTLNFGSPFNGSWAYRNTTVTPSFDETSTYRAFQRSFRLSFGYRFGQQQQTKQRKSISNDDVKGGASKQGGQ
ncbi:TonB-dependent receptor domain-containing protein [Hymenobacter terricola]|uniref:TonB-dependent receptor domain-containing protein n=1 Tax=Hymenobacter terricola TaxID=2819236 RepID=UPI001B30BCDF|nr:TonB-dependent receptor [Hymenobacter terricola]